MGEPAELRTARRYTAATLWLIVLSAGVTQFVVGLVAEPMIDGRTVALLSATGLGTLLAVAVVPLLLRGIREVRVTHPLVLAVIAVALGTWVLAVVSPFAGWGWGISLSLAAGVLSCLVANRLRIPVFLGGYALIVLVWVFGIALGDTVDIPDAETIAVLLMMLLYPVTIFLAVWSHEVVLRLDRARRLADELAVARERLRFATDLHDIQGHHLQVIALKSELAERLLAKDPEAASRELTQIRETARTALEDTRAVVHNYRTITVSGEARNAAEILRSAGIECRVSVEGDEAGQRGAGIEGLPVEVGTALAHVIREGTTNLLRHSRATWASIELAREPLAGDRERQLGTVLTVTNDGARTVAVVQAVRGSQGTGIRGLAERVASVGGKLEHRREGDTFTLIARIPDNMTAASDEATDHRPGEDPAAHDGGDPAGRVGRAAQESRGDRA